MKSNLIVVNFSAGLFFFIISLFPTMSLAACDSKVPWIYLGWSQTCDICCKNLSDQSCKDSACGGGCGCYKK